MFWWKAIPRRLKSWLIKEYTAEDQSRMIVTSISLWQNRAIRRYRAIISRIGLADGVPDETGTKLNKTYSAGDTSGILDGC